jgi:hypothetical protein
MADYGRHTDLQIFVEIVKFVRNLSNVAPFKDMIGE